MFGDIPITTWISLVALLISAIGIIRTFHKDSTEDTAFNVTISTKLDSIVRGVDDIKLDIRDLQKKQNGMDAVISEIRSDVRNLEKRVEHLETQ